MTDGARGYQWNSAKVNQWDSEMLMMDSAKVNQRDSAKVNQWDSEVLTADSAKVNQRDSAKVNQWDSEVLTADSARTLAVEHNRTLLMAKEEMKAAHYERRAAITNFLPKVSAMGTYMYNQKEVSLLSGEQKQALNHLGNHVEDALKGGLGPLVNVLEVLDIATPLNALGQRVTKALRTDTRHVWAGGVSLVQPLYAGGKISAYAKVTRQAELLAYNQWETVKQEVVEEVEATYWLAVSLAKRKELAEEYLHLVKTLEADVAKLSDAGMATRADELTVSVKVNEGEMALTEVTDGLNLTRMLLCQLCGLPPDTTMKLADEGRSSLPPTPQDRRARSVAVAWGNRPELKSLQAVHEMAKQNVCITRADYLPSVALTGNYLVSNPSLTNGFERRFRGTWNVGVLVSIPLFHWGEGIYKVRESQVEVHRADLLLQNVREEIDLQVHQCTYRMDEAYRHLTLAESNVAKADENMRTARLAFQEGILTTSQVMEAQTAWLAAQVAHLDAQIEVKMADVALRRALGVLE